MSCNSPYGCLDPRVPRSPPVNLNHNSNMSSSGATIQNGRITRHRRRTFFNFGLYRVSQLIQHPGQVTFRELCLIVLGLYALYRLYFTGGRILDLTAGQKVQDVCYGMSFAGCGRTLFWKVVYLLGAWLGQVIPWALICLVVIFFGEGIMRRKG